MSYECKYVGGKCSFPHPAFTMNVNFAKGINKVKSYNTKLQAFDESDSMSLGLWLLEGKLVD